MSPKPVSDESAKVAALIFVNITTTGKRAKTCAVPIHELPLIRAQNQLSGEAVQVDLDWVSGSSRIRLITHEEYLAERERMVRRYSQVVHCDRAQDLISGVYGHNASALAAAMRRGYDRYQALAKRDGPDLTPSGWRDLEDVVAGAEKLPEIQMDPIEEPEADEPDQAIDARILDACRERKIGATIARQLAQLCMREKTLSPEFDELMKIAKGSSQTAATLRAALEQVVDKSAAAVAGG